MKKPLVYIASPLTRGDCGANVHFQCEMFHKLWTDGIVVPFTPLMTFMQHVVFPMSYDEWISWDNELLPRCDALLRLNATHKPTGYFQSESSGADGEVALATALGIPVFYQLDLLYEWSRTQYEPRQS